jgi:benzoyl-CoA reductase/2-hydroxyglutaryl-CoA dehydratase subunit BcrC/BadD/HgdB
MYVTCFAGAQEQFDTAAGYGTPVDVCSIQRAMIGMAKNGLLPTPDMVVSASAVCDSELKSFEVIGKHFGCPYFFLDQPYWYNKEGIEYYVKELEDLVSFLEDLTKQKLNIDKLKEVMKLSRQATALYRQVNEYRKLSPTPMRNLDFFNLCMVYALMAGTQEAVDYFELVLQEVKEIAEGKRAPLRPKERFRLSCTFCLPVFSMEILDWMEREHGAVIAADLPGFWRLDEEIDPEKPLESLARKAFYAPLALPFLGPAENWSESAVKMAVDHEIDGALLFAPITCKEGCAMIRILKDQMREKANIPTLLACCDAIDPSVASPEELKSQMEGFFETLQEHKG